MIYAVLVLYDIRINGRMLEVEQHLRITLQVSKVLIGIAPIYAVIRNSTIICQQREVHHIFTGLLVIDSLGSPYTCDMFKVLTSIFCREVHGTVLPVNHILGFEEPRSTLFPQSPRFP